jgi:hypothetical protein
MPGFYRQRVNHPSGRVSRYFASQRQCISVQDQNHKEYLRYVPTSTCLTPLTSPPQRVTGPCDTSASKSSPHFHSHFGPALSAFHSIRLGGSLSRREIRSCSCRENPTQPIAHTGQQNSKFNIPSVLNYS